MPYSVTQKSSILLGDGVLINLTITTRNWIANNYFLIGFKNGLHQGEFAGHPSSQYAIQQI